MGKYTTTGRESHTGKGTFAGLVQCGRTWEIAGVSLVLTGVVLFALVLPVFGNPSLPSPGEGELEVIFSGGHISLKANQVQLARVLSEIEKQTGIKVTTDDAAAFLREKVNLDITHVALEKVLKQLFSNRAFVYAYNAEQDAYFLSAAGVFNAGGKTTGGLKMGGGPKKNAVIPKTAPPTSIPLAGRRVNRSQIDSRPAYITGEILVRLKENVTARKIEALHTALESEVLNRIPSLRVERIRIKTGLDEETALERYRVSGLVDIAGRHALRYPNVTPNDPYYGSQWGHTASGIPDGWQFTTGNSGIVVAVIDSGVHYQHPDLAANIWTNPNEIPGNGIDDDANGYVDDVRGWDFAGTSRTNANDADPDPADGDTDSHGTHVAGIIGARGNNATGVAGVAWDVRIMPLKVQANDSKIMESVDIIAAFQYALENGARVVNCSFGGPGDDPVEHSVIRSLRDAGILVVCAAGNGDDNYSPLNTDETPHYPSGYNLANIVAVAAGTRADGLASFSNYGAASVDLMAPGVDILSTVQNNGYISMQGTSMAAPFVAGAAGLILSRKPTWHYPEVKAALLNTATRLPVLSGKVLTGGKLNAHYALCSSGTVAGDVTCDNTVDAMDSTVALQIVAGAGPEICTTCLSAGIDIDGDLKVGLEEAAYAIRRNSGM